jgi:hypothetical protein
VKARVRVRVRARFEVRISRRPVSQLGLLRKSLPLEHFRIGELVVAGPFGLSWGTQIAKDLLQLIDLVGLMLEIRHCVQEGQMAQSKENG